MNTIQYMGSKRDLLTFIEVSIEKYTSDKKEKIKVFYDAFSGSGRVANHFKDTYRVISSDKQHFTKVINDAYMNNHIDDKTIDLYIDKLNNIDMSQFKATDGWFTEKYSASGMVESIGEDKNPKIWMEKNAKKIDIIRTEIEKDAFYTELKDEREEIRSILLLSLILAVNKVSNVVGHQNGYLKKWCDNAKNDLVLANPNTYTHKEEKRNHKNIQGDIFKILSTVNADITYFDPPYGTNNEVLSVATRYSSFYHLWNTLVINDRPVLFGKAGKPISTKGWTADLEKNKRQLIKIKFQQLIEKSSSPYVAFSYSNQGLLTKKEFFEVYSDSGCEDVVCFEQGHRVNSQKTTAKKEGEFIERDPATEKLVEYLFVGTKKKVDVSMVEEKKVDILEKMLSVDIGGVSKYIDSMIKSMTPDSKESKGDNTEGMIDLLDKISELKEEKNFLKKLSTNNLRWRYTLLITELKIRKKDNKYSTDLIYATTKNMRLLGRAIDRVNEFEASKIDKRYQNVSSFQKREEQLTEDFYQRKRDFDDVKKPTINEYKEIILKLEKENKDFHINSMNRLIASSNRNSDDSCCDFKKQPKTPQKKVKRKKKAVKKKGAKDE